MKTSYYLILLIIGIIIIHSLDNRKAHKPQKQAVSVRPDSLSNPAGRPSFSPYAAYAASINN